MAEVGRQQMPRLHLQQIPARDQSEGLEKEIQRQRTQTCRSYNNRPVGKYPGV